jgi:hypothetical protein
VAAALHRPHSGVGYQTPQAFRWTDDRRTVNMAALGGPGGLPTNRAILTFRADLTSGTHHSRRLRNDGGSRSIEQRNLPLYALGHTRIVYRRRSLLDCQVTWCMTSQDDFSSSILRASKQVSHVEVLWKKQRLVGSYRCCGKSILMRKVDCGPKNFSARKRDYRREPLDVSKMVR